MVVYITDTAFEFAGYTLNFSALMITAGILLTFLLGMILYGVRNGHVYPVIVFAPFAFLFAVVIGRITHWYFNSESYSSLASAFTEWDVGSFTLPGALIGMWLGAFVTEKIRACDDRWAILDAITPGTVLLIMLIRLSAWFNTSCRSRITVDFKYLQTLPFAIATTDNAGNVTYKFATFLVEAILLLVLFLFVCEFHRHHGLDRMVRKCDRNGHTARIALVAYGCIEIIMDSTRSDSPLMRFKILSSLNQYSAFVSFAQVFAAIVGLLIIIYYSFCAIRAKGFKWYYIPLWLAFLGSAFVIGFLGEYKVQRTGLYLRCYSLMLAGCVVFFLCVYISYRLCIRKERWRDYEY